MRRVVLFLKAPILMGCLMAASPNALAQGLQGYNFMLTPEANVQMRQVQQQQALAQALQEKGLDPVSTNNRQIGGVGYAISPWEGAAKAAQALVGAYEQKSANNKFADIMNPPQDTPPAPAPIAPPPDPNQPGPSGGPITAQASYPGDQPGQQPPPEVGAPGFQQLPALPPQMQQQPAPAAQQSMQGPFSPAFTGALQQIQQKYNLSPMEALQVLQDPSALARVISANAPTPEMKNAQAAYGQAGAAPAIRNIMNNQQFPGQVSMQQGLGAAAAQQAPAGQQPAGPGLPGLPQQPPPSFPPQPSGYQVGNAGIQLPYPPPQAAGGIQGLPSGATPALQNAVAPAPGQAPAAGGAPPAQGAALPPIDPTGMTNAQMQAAVEAQKAGASSLASHQGENLAQAQKGVAAIDSRIASAKAIIEQMKALAPQVPYGPHGMAEAQVDFSNIPGIGSGKAAGAHDSFETMNNNLFTQELPGVVQASGGRVDIPIVNSVKSASSVKLDSHPNAKIQNLNILSDMLDKVQANAHDNLARLQSGVGPQQIAPPQAQGTAPKTTNWTFQNGKLVAQ